MESLTHRQAEVLNIIMDRGDTPPTYKEIGKALGIKRETAYGIVVNLIAKGWVERTAGKWRGLRVKRPDLVRERIRKGTGHGPKRPRKP